MFFDYQEKISFDQVKQYAKLVHICARDDKAIKAELDKALDKAKAELDKAKRLPEYNVVKTWFWDALGKVSSYADPNRGHVLPWYQHPQESQGTENDATECEYVVAPGYKLTLLLGKDSPNKYYVVLGSDWVDPSCTVPCIDLMLDILINSLPRGSKPQLLVLAHGLGGLLAVPLTLAIYEKHKDHIDVQCLTFDAVDFFELSEDYRYRIDLMEIFRHIVSTPNVMNMEWKPLGEVIYVYNAANSSRDAPRYSNDYCHFLARRAAHNVWLLKFLRFLKDPTSALHIKKRAQHEAALMECFIPEDAVCVHTQKHFDDLHGNKLRTVLARLQKDLIIRSDRNAEMAILSQLRDKCYGVSRFSNIFTGTPSAISLFSKDKYSFAHLLTLKNAWKLNAFKGELCSDAEKANIVRESESDNIKYQAIVETLAKIATHRAWLFGSIVVPNDFSVQQKIYVYAFLRSMWIFLSAPDLNAAADIRRHAQILAYLIPEPEYSIQSLMAVRKSLGESNIQPYAQHVAWRDIAIRLAGMYQHVLVAQSNLGAGKLAFVHMKKLIRQVGQKNTYVEDQRKIIKKVDELIKTANEIRGADGTAENAEMIMKVGERIMGAGKTIEKAGETITSAGKMIGDRIIMKAGERIMSVAKALQMKEALDQKKEIMERANEIGLLLIQALVDQTIENHFDPAGDYSVSEFKYRVGGQLSAKNFVALEHPISALAFVHLENGVVTAQEGMQTEVLSGAVLSTQIIPEMSRDLRPVYGQLAAGQSDDYCHRIAYRTELDRAAAGELYDAVHFATMRDSSVRIFIWSVNQGGSSKGLVLGLGQVFSSLVRYLLSRLSCSSLPKLSCSFPVFFSNCLSMPSWFQKFSDDFYKAVDEGWFGFLYPCVQVGGHTAMAIKGTDTVGNSRFEYISLYSGNVLDENIESSTPRFLVSYSALEKHQMSLLDREQDRLKDYGWYIEGDMNRGKPPIHADFVIDIACTPEQIKAMIETYDGIRSCPEEMVYAAVTVCCGPRYNCNSLVHHILSSGNYQKQMRINSTQAFLFGVGKTLREGLPLFFVMLLTTWFYDVYLSPGPDQGSEEQDALRVFSVTFLRMLGGVLLAFMWEVFKRAMKSIHVSVAPASFQSELIAAAARMTAPDIQLVHTKKTLENIHYIDQSFKL